MDCGCSIHYQPGRIEKEPSILSNTECQKSQAFDPDDNGINRFSKIWTTEMSHIRISEISISHVCARS